MQRPTSRPCPLYTALCTAFCLALAVLLCSACGRGGGGALETGLAGQLAQAGLPAPAELRSASLIDNLQTGAQAVDFDPEAGVKNSSLVLEPNTADGFEWGIWAFGPADPAPGDVQVSVSVTAIDPAPMFVLLANFQRGSWDLVQQLEISTAQEITVPFDPLLNVAPDGRVLIAVVLIGGGEYQLSVDALNFRQPGVGPLNAEITADVSSGEAPLSVTLDASASTGNIVKFEWDTSGSGNFTADTGTVPTLESSYSAPGIFNATVRVTDDTGSTDTASIPITVTLNGNLPPSASLVPDVTEGDGETGFTVNLVSEASEDPDGTISLFEWDLDGDASTGTNGFEVSSANPDPQQATVSSPGELRLRLRVTDDDGLQSTASVIITGRGWLQVPLLTLPAGKSAGGVALSRVGKGPVVSFVNGNTNLLEFVRSSSVHGNKAADWKITDITGAQVGKATDIVDVDSRAAICFGGLDDALTYVRSNTADGGQQTDWEIVTVDAVDALGMSMALVEGKPAISYIERSNLGNVGLKYAFSSSDTGIDPADWDSLTVQAADAQIQALGSFTSLQVVDGKPAIAWQSVIDSLDAKRFVNFAHSASSGGTSASDWDVTLALQECIDRQLCLALVNGRPAIGFGAKLPVDNTATYLHSSSAGGVNSDDWAAVKIGASGEGGFNSELGVIDGLPVLSYSRDIGSDSQIGLRLAESSSADGALVNDWLSQDQVTDPNQMQDGSTDHDLAVIDGYPALVFFDQQSGIVTYTIRF